jgi:hypothetical protein
METPLIGGMLGFGPAIAVGLGVFSFSLLACLWEFRWTVMDFY